MVRQTLKTADKAPFRRIQLSFAADWPCPAQAADTPAIKRNTPIHLPGRLLHKAALKAWRWMM
jgi:hypothetical protein